MITNYLNLDKFNKRIPIAYIMAIYAGDNPPWVVDAIDSLRAQINPELFDLRLYISIDGPISIQLESVLESREDFIYKIIRSKSNKGLAHALNMCISLLTDEVFIFRMDSDDISLPGRTMAQIEYMSNDHNIGICGGAIEEFGDESITTVRKFYLDHESIRANMYKGTALAHVSACFRRTALDALMKYSETSPFNEDIELWFRALQLNIKFHNLEDILVRVRINDQFFKRRSFTKALVEFKVYWQGCLRLYGFSSKQFVVVFRLIFRLMPSHIVKFIYKSNAREKFFG